MIIYHFLSIILTIFAGLDHLVMPVLPSGLNSVLLTVVRYLQSGLNFIFTFLDKNYCSQLFSWWITFGTLVLSYEIILSVWHLVTGNSHTQPVTYDGSSSGSSSEYVDAVFPDGKTYDTFRKDFYDH